jgi:small neutral amino acid transporter SnatA (MarC family)
VSRFGAGQLIEAGNVLRPSGKCPIFIDMSGHALEYVRERVRAENPARSLRIIASFALLGAVVAGLFGTHDVSNFIPWVCAGIGAVVGIVVVVKHAL